MNARPTPLVRALTLTALLLTVAVYFMPIWWVSLTAPNYPVDAFPDGIRIHFHFDGVHNGCTTAPKTSRLMKETLQEDLGEGTERYNPVLEGSQGREQNAQALDCVHEMNTINHYVGMHPIGIGAPVERQLARYFFGFFAVMLLAFTAASLRLRLTILGVGFAAVMIWMSVELWIAGGIDRFSAHYVQDAGAFFRDAERIQQWGNTLRAVTQGVAVGLIGAMVLVWVLCWRFRRFQLVLPLVSALLPMFFLFTYAGWLWFFGHRLHPWGAFTVKPFMPTVFGEGKVAQFSTYSYPHYGFAILLAISALLFVALLLRRKQLRDESGE